MDAAVGGPTGGDSRSQRVRALALGVLLYRDHGLFAELDDRVTGERLYRALGGEIDFGERSAEALVREFREEIGAAVRIVAPLGVSENRFTFDGKPGHHVVFEYVAEYEPGDAPPNLDPMERIEPAGTVARWLPLAEVLAGVHRVVPDGLPQRLAAWVNTL